MSRAPNHQWNRSKGLRLYNHRDSYVSLIEGLFSWLDRISVSAISIETYSYDGCAQEWQRYFERWTLNTLATPQILKNLPLAYRRTRQAGFHGPRGIGHAETAPMLISMTTNTRGGRRGFHLSGWQTGSTPPRTPLTANLTGPIRSFDFKTSTKWFPKSGAEWKGPVDINRNEKSIDYDHWEKNVPMMRHNYSLKCWCSVTPAAPEQFWTREPLVGSVKIP